MVLVSRYQQIVELRDGMHLWDRWLWNIAEKQRILEAEGEAVQFQAHGARPGKTLPKHLP